MVTRDQLAERRRPETVAIPWRHGRAVVAVDSLAKRYGRTDAVVDVSFGVDEGEIFGLLGPNGSGKTTTVERVQGLRRPDAESIRVFGHDALAERKRVRRLIGSQLQDSALPDRMRVWEALELFSLLAPGSRQWPDLMEEWGLAAQRRTAFGDLSGGQRQRLFVALALVADPRLVILDEMTTGLDPVARRVAWDLVADVRKRDATVLLVTLFMDEAERLCDRVAVVQRAGSSPAAPRQTRCGPTNRTSGFASRPRWGSTPGSCDE